MLKDSYWQEWIGDIYTEYQKLGGEKAFDDFEKCIADFIEIAEQAFVVGDPGESKYMEQITKDSLRDKVSYRVPAYKYWAIEVGDPEEAKKIFDAIREIIELS